MHHNRKSKGNSEQRLLAWTQQPFKTNDKGVMIRRPPTRGHGQGPIRTDANGIDRQKLYNKRGKR